MEIYLFKLINIHEKKKNAPVSRNREKYIHEQKYAIHSFGVPATLKIFYLSSEIWCEFSTSEWKIRKMRQHCQLFNIQHYKFSLAKVKLFKIKNVYRCHNLALS